MLDMIANHPDLIPCVSTQIQSPLTDLDLAVRDTDFDLGWGYQFGWYFDKSPDIWVRNQPDGLTNQIHEDPEYDSLNPVYVYIRVRNIGCATSLGTESMNLYWSKASSSSSWPANWDGTQPTIGNSIGNKTIPVLMPGEETILEFQWTILNPNQYNNWASCLLVRVNAGINDPFVANIDLGQEVFLNNNIALRNVTVLDNLAGKAEPGWINDVYYPHGRYMFIGNASAYPESYDIHFEVPEASIENSIINEGEVKLIFEDVGWNLMLQAGIDQNPGIEILEPKVVVINQNAIQINDVSFLAEQRIPVYVGFSFYSEQITPELLYEYRVSQTKSSDSLLIGAVHFEIYKHQRSPFQADAGEDELIYQNQNITLDAEDINEQAIYNWYDSEGNAIHTGQQLSVSPDSSSVYQLEVIAENDGFKDYDQVTVTVLNCLNTSISPNPNSTPEVDVNYQIEGAGSAYLMISAPYSYVSNNYLLNTNSNSITIPISSYSPGSYYVFLVVDGQIVHSKILIIL